MIAPRSPRHSNSAVLSKAVGAIKPPGPKLAQGPGIVKPVPKAQAPTTSFKKPAPAFKGPKPFKAPKLGFGSVLAGKKAEVASGLARGESEERQAGKKGMKFVKMFDQLTKAVEKARPPLGWRPEEKARKEHLRGLMTDAHATEVALGKGHPHAVAARKTYDDALDAAAKVRAKRIHNFLGGEGEVTVEYPVVGMTRRFPDVHSAARHIEERALRGEGLRILPRLNKSMEKDVAVMEPPKKLTPPKPKVAAPERAKTEDLSEGAKIGRKVMQGMAAERARHPRTYHQTPIKIEFSRLAAMFEELSKAVQLARTSGYAGSERRLKPRSPSGMKPAYTIHDAEDAAFAAHRASVASVKNPAQTKVAAKMHARAAQIHLRLGNRAQAQHHWNEALDHDALVAAPELTKAWKGEPLGASIARAQTHLKMGLQSWVDGYKAARKSGNVKTAKRLRDSIQSKIDEHQLHPDTVWGPDPDRS